MSADNLSAGDRPAAALPPFNPMAPGFHDNPYPFFHRYRERDPVHWSTLGAAPGAGMWYLFRNDDVMAALRNPNLIRDPRILPPAPLRGMLEKWMLFRNPPDHTRLRSLVSKAFTPQRAERLVPAIQSTADFLIDAVADRGQMDVIADYASPLPLIVIAELLGVPAEDREQLRRWTIDMVVAIDFGPSREGMIRAMAAARDLMAYLRELIVIRRHGVPRDDLISALLAAEEQGDRLSEDELLSMCSLLLGAGHETTVNLIGNGSLALMTQRDQWERLCAHPEVLETGVDELLRFDSPVQMTFREAAADGELAGRPIQKGDLVAILLGSANRDPALFPDPDRLDLARPVGKHAAFGMGIHFCLGSHLARLEGRIAFETLARRLPHMRLVPGPLERREGIAFRGVKALPVTF